MSTTSEATSTSSTQADPWGFWATTGFAVGAICLLLATQLGVGFLYAQRLLTEAPDVSLEDLIASVVSDGLYISLAGIGSMLVVLGFLFFVVLMRKNAVPQIYFALKPAPLPSIALGICGLALYFTITELCSIALGVSEVSRVDLFLTIRETSQHPILLWASIVVCGPLVEEFLFRGFMFQGYRHSKIGRWGTIVLTSVFWTLMHSQYDWFGMAVVLGLGLILGIAREKSESLILPITIHVLWNIIVAIQVELA